MGKKLIVIIFIILSIVFIGGILYYLSLPKFVAKELNYPNLISCVDLDGENIKFKSTSQYVTEYADGDKSRPLEGSITDYCEKVQLVNGKPPIKEAICEGSDSYFVIKTCGWFSKCVDGRCI
jgi:hypothetical protein